MKFLNAKSIGLGVFLALNLVYAERPALADTKPAQKESKVENTDKSASAKVRVPQYEANPKSVELNEEGAAAVKRDKFKEAEELFLKAHLADPKNLTAVFNLAGMYLNNKKIKDGIDLLEGYVKNYKNDAGLYARLGDCYFSDKQVEKAVQNYEKARALQSDYRGLPGKLATLYLLSNDPLKAEKMLNEAVKQDPRDARALANLSSLQLALKKPAEAVKTAQRSAQIVPSSEVYVTMGSAYEALKDYKNSLVAFERARDLGDARPELEEKIESVKKAAS